MTKQIPLTRGQVALVDEADYDWLNQWKWCAHYDVQFDRWVAVRAGRKEDDSHLVYMHRQITAAKKGQQVDHINRDPLDNRRSNLRICSQSENQRNRATHKNNKSGYKGVRWVESMRKWRVNIGKDGRHIHLGYYDNIIMAARAYNAAAVEHFGEFARLNEL